MNYNKLGFLIMASIVFTQSISIASEPFDMVVIGDSIAWGAGIEENQKYYSLVRDWIAQEKDIPRESIELQVLAHTGAMLFTENYDPERSPDLISGNPTIAHQADMILNPDDVDLILVSGGINDISVDNILRLEQLTSFRGTIVDKGWIDPNNAVYSGLTNLFTGTPEQKYDDPTYPISKVQERSSGIRTPMHLLLNKLLNKCPNARIVVTSYYPIISTDSKGLSDAILALVPKSKDIEDYKHLDEPDRKRQLIDKSGIFYTESTRSLRAAVNDANSDSRSNRVAFAQVVFKPINSYGADQTWLWRITNGPNGATIDDIKFSTRMLLLSTEKFDPDEYAKNKFAAVGHPNERGAIEYKERIINTISNTWPNWLKKPDSPSSPTSTAPSSDDINELLDINQWSRSLSSGDSTWTDMLQNMLPSVSGWPLYIFVIILALIIGGSLIRKSLWDFIMNAISGLVVIYLSSLYLGIGIAITIPTLLVCAIGGFPGAIILIALKYFYGITF